MENKNKLFLIGGILLFIGLFLIGKGIVFFSNTYLLFVGVAFLLVYKFKNRNYALVPGLMLTFLGILQFLKIKLGIVIQVEIIFFLFPAIIMLEMYRKNKKDSLLLLGNVLLSVSAFLIISKYLPRIIILNNVGLFLFFLGLSFIASYKISNRLKMKFIKYYGIALSVIGIAIIVFYKTS